MSAVSGFVRYQPICDFAPSVNTPVGLLANGRMGAEPEAVERRDEPCAVRIGALALVLPVAAPHAPMGLTN
jgi:hypothetical protein